MNNQLDSFRLVLCCDDDSNLERWQRRAPAYLSVEILSSTTCLSAIAASLLDAPFALVGLGEGCAVVAEQMSALAQAGCVPAHIMLIHPTTTDMQTDPSVPLDIICSDNDVISAAPSQRVTLVPTNDVWSAMVLEQLVRIITTQHLFRCYHESILIQAIKTPTAVALVASDLTLSYQELCSRAWALSRRIRPFAPPGTHIAFSLPLGTSLVVSYLASSMLQCPFTEAPSSQSVEITAKQLNEWKPALMIHARDQLPHPELVACVGACMPFDDQPHLDQLAPDLSAVLSATRGGDIDAPAFIAWTSGSTGRSKGACATYKHLANMAFWRWWEFPPTAEDPNVCAQNLFFVWYWFMPLFQGGTTVIIPPATLVDPPQLVELFEKHQVTRWDCSSPTLLRTILQTSEAQLIDRLAKQLTTVHSGGELLEVDTCRLFHKCMSQLRLINGFATTETVCDISFCEMTSQLTNELLAANAFAAPVRQGSMGSSTGMAWNSHFSLIDLSPDIAKNFSAATGQLVASGVQTAKSYYQRPEISKCFGTKDGIDFVKLNDVAEELHLQSGSYLVVRGRTDSCVKVRGFRVELSVVEDAVKRLSGVVDGAVVVHADALVAFVAGESLPSNSELFSELSRLDLPAGHLPSYLRKVESLPVTTNGKIDRKQLVQSLSSPSVTAAPAPLLARDPKAVIESQVRKAWEEVLGHSAFSPESNFFEVGGHSLHALRLAAILKLPTATVLGNPNFESLVDHLASLEEPATTNAAASTNSRRSDDSVHGVAVVAMAVRVGDVQDIDTFWEALLEGREFGSDHSKAEMAAAGAPVGDDQWVPRSGALATDLLKGCDVELFGMSVTEARATDPSQRLALECAYEVLEAGGVLEPSKKPQRVGVFMSGGALAGYLNEVIKEPDAAKVNPARYMQLEVGNDKDYIATRIAHKFNLTGPAKTIQTACSSSLVCIADAVESLRSGKCEMAIAGGSHVAMPKAGYRYQPGMIWSPDGYCRPFDASASGIYECSAVGVVLLKPEHTVLPTDHVYAIVRGVAVNNDGAQKAGYWAPSVSGQTAVVTEAINDAGLNSGSIGYVECHGTGTPLGDPIEISALTKAHQATGHVQSAECALGSVKSNMGHAGAAAGVVGFVKMVLTLHHKTIAPTLHYQTTNPEIKLSESRFHVAHSEPQQFPEPSQQHPRTAAVSSFGIGGTNAHVVAQEAANNPRNVKSSTGQPGMDSIILMSAMTQSALHAGEKVTAAWATGAAGRDSDIRDVERTLAKSRWHLRHRSVIVCDSVDSIAASLNGGADVIRGSIRNGNGSGQVALMLTGSDEHMLANAASICQCWPLFDSAIKECQAVSPMVVTSMLGSKDNLELGQFAVCYAMATAIIDEFSLKVATILADGVGHLVAAVITGVMPLRTALHLVESEANRSNSWLQRLGAARAGQKPKSRLHQYSDDSDFQSNASSESSDDSHEVVPSEQPIQPVKARQTMDQLDVDTSLWQLPTVPIFSCETLKVIDTNQIVSEAFWSKMIHKSADHDTAVKQVKVDFPGAAVLQCGATKAASTSDAVFKLPEHGDWAAWGSVLGIAASLWCAGAHVNWSNHLDRRAEGHTPHSVVLPKYQFDRVDCWPEPPKKAANKGAAAMEMSAKGAHQECGGVLYHMDWVAAPQLPLQLHLNPRTPVFGFDAESTMMVQRDWPGEFFACAGIEEAVQAAAVCGRLVLTGAASESLDAVDFDAQSKLCWTLIELVQQLVRAHRRCKLWFVSNGTLQYSSLWGFAKAIALELPELEMSRVLWDGVSHQSLFHELSRPDGEEQEVRLLPSGARQVPRLQPHALCNPAAHVTLDPEGTYVVTGGKRGLGLEVAKHLVNVMGVRNLVLLGRSSSSDAAVELFMGWRERGCTVVERCMDVADSDAVSAVLQYIHQEMVPLKGIVHCAGVVHDGVVLRSDKPGTDAVLEPKLAAWTLHQQCEQYEPLDFMLLFSSTAAIWGTAGQGSYCAANAYLDEFAEWRSSQGHKTISVQWGGWDEVGMSADLGITSQNGEKYLTPEVGLSALHAILADSLNSTSTRAVVAAIDVQDKPKYRADRALFLNSHDRRVEIWDAPRSMEDVQVQHPLLGVQLPSRCGVLHTWQAQFTGRVEGAQFLVDHTLDGTQIFPGTGYIEMFLSACSALPEFSSSCTVVMSGVQFLHPLRLAPAEARAVQTMIMRKDRPDCFTARIASRRIAPDGSADENWVVHATCELQSEAERSSVCLLPTDVSRESTAKSRSDAHQLYHEFGEAGFDYGPAFAAVRDVWHDHPDGRELQAIGKVQACGDITSAVGAAQYLLHPALLDACSQLASLVHPASFGGIPSSIAEIRISLETQAMQPQLPEYWVRALSTDGSVNLSIWASECARVPMVTLSGVELATLPGPAGPILYETVWDEIDLTSKPSLPTPKDTVWVVWSVNGASHEVADSMADHLTKQSDQRCVRLQCSLNDGWAAAVQQVGKSKVAGVLICDTESENEQDSSVCEALWQLGCDTQVLEQLCPDARLWVVTSEGLDIEAQIRTAALQATAKRLWVDAPAVMCSTVHLELTTDVTAVCQLMQSGGECPAVVAARGSKLLTPQLARTEQTTEAARTTSTELKLPSAGEAYQVRIEPSKGLAGVYTETFPLAAPAADEVQLDTSCWALNFRDVLVAIGAIPTLTSGKELGMGGECIGRVVSVGSSVEGLAVGDTVLGCPSDGFGSLANVPAQFVFKLPECSPEAPHLLMVYATAWLALIKMGRVARGDTVLVHSAAGGVGLCAVHIALQRGATVYGTASTVEKRAYLEQLGVTQTYSSRDLNFVDGIRAATQGKGVDMVLNSLSGSAMVASIDLVAPFGRFLEIGKRDQYEGTTVSLAPLLKGISICAAHLDVLMIEQPSVARAMMLEVWEEITTGRLPTLPTRSFPITQLPAALQYMSEGKHIGKIVVSMGADSSGSSPISPPLKPRHVVCGPLNEASVWLALQAAASGSQVSLLTVASDSSDKLAGALEAAEAASVEIAVCNCADDISSKLKELHPITSVVHLAVQHDAFTELFARELHEVALGAPETLSSLVTIAPSSGGVLSESHLPQSKFDPRVPLHALLHALAKARESAGVRPTCCICLDVLKLADPTTGWSSSSCQEERALRSSRVQRTPLEQLHQTICKLSQQPTLSSCSLTVIPTVGHRLHQRSRSLYPIFRPEMPVSAASLSNLIKECVVRFVADLANIEPEDIEPLKSLEEYGLDSLSALGLAAQLQAITPAASVLDVMDHSTVDALVKQLAQGADGDTADDDIAPVTRPVTRLLVLHGFRTNAEITQMQLAPVLSAMGGECVCEYALAPHSATGPADPGIPAGFDLHEWWGEWSDKSDHGYQEAWRGPHYDGLQHSIESLHKLIATKGPFDGIVGFSQGAAMAALVLAHQACSKKAPEMLEFKFGIMFSGIIMPAATNATAICVPTLHVYDQSEEFVEEMEGLYGAFEPDSTTRIFHSEGHNIPKDLVVCQRVASFVEEQL